ncbi:MAG: hypothetical protein WBZ36_29450 [Candidatus Nitrosopolaris sp.]
MVDSLHSIVNGIEKTLENQQKGIAGDIYAFILVTASEHVKLHINQFADRREFMLTILNTMVRYDTLARYNIFNFWRNHIEEKSDFGHLESNCSKLDLDFSKLESRVNFLDVYRIYHNETVDNFLKTAYNVKYRGETLDATAKAFLGKGKLEGISGVNVEFLPPEEQLSYCFQDSLLCYELLQQKNFELLQKLYEISQEIKKPFFETCNAKWPTMWWSLN